MANKRITDVDYINSLNSDESFFVNQNNSIKQIDKDNIVFGISNGGTGATTAAAALKNLGITATAAELNKMDGVTATTTELNYVDGVTSDIQTQLNEVGTKIDNAILNHTHSSLKSITGGTVELAYGASASSMGGTGEAGHYLAPSGGSDDYYLGSSSNHWSKAYIDNLRLSNALPISMGGTGAATAAAALANLGGIEIIDANSDAYDMDETITNGLVKFYNTGTNTKGTPKAYGVTTFHRALIISYSTSATYGAQLALSSGGYMWHRRNNDGKIGPWRRITTQKLISGTDYGSNFPTDYEHSEDTKGTIFYKKVSS